MFGLTLMGDGLNVPCARVPFVGAWVYLGT
jgi:hypothetical protein